MKNLKRFTLLLVVTLFIASCSSDDAEKKPEEIFAADGETFDFKDANLYLAGEAYFSNGNGGYDLRNYIITDGTFVAGNGWELSHYTDATYFFAFQVYVPEGDDFAAGNFPSVTQFAAPEGNSLYFYGETADTQEYYESNLAESLPEFTIGGGMNDGQTMTIKFNGTLSHWERNEIWRETEFTGNMFISAKVQEVSTSIEAGK